MKKLQRNSKFAICVAAALFTTQAGVTPLMANQSYQNSTISTVAWTTDYQAALKQASAEGKIVALFFTGSDWCTWCHKLEQEVFDKPAFAELAKDRFIFVKLDYPKRSQLDPKTKIQNDQLQKKYQIKGYPTVILIDSNEQVLAETGYEQGGPQKYAAHLNALTSSKVVAKAETFDSLKTKFLSAKAAGNLTSALAVAEEGVNLDQNDFFEKERFAVAVKLGKTYEPQTRAVKERLLSKNQHYFVAVSEFEGLSSQLETGALSAAQAVEPLVKYADQFGLSDQENGWRIEATIAEVYYSKAQYSDALKWANLAYDHAPQSHKDKMQKMIVTIESDLKTKTEIAQGN